MYSFPNLPSSEIGQVENERKLKTFVKKTLFKVVKSKKTKFLKNHKNKSELNIFSILSFIIALLSVFMFVFTLYFLTWPFVIITSLLYLTAFVVSIIGIANIKPQKGFAIAALCITGVLGMIIILVALIISTTVVD